MSISRLLLAVLASSPLALTSSPGALLTESGFVLTGPAPVTPEDFASVAAKLSGREVVVQDVTREQLAEDHAARGMQPHAVELSLLLEDALRSGALSTATQDVERILGSGGMSFQDHMLRAVGPRIGERS